MFYAEIEKRERGEPVIPEMDQTTRAQLEVLKILGESCDDYLFLWEIKTGRLYFAGDISVRYPVARRENQCYTLQDWYDIVYEKDLPNLQQELKRICQGGVDRYAQEYRLVDRDGNQIWVSCRGQCQRDEHGHPRALIGRISSTAMELIMDPLTGAFNAAQLMEDMEQIQAAGAPCFLLILGVDNLKYINLRYGRAYGSRILRLMADTLEKVVGVGQRIYRLNGDCFAINLAVSEQEKVTETYRQLCQRINDSCTISAGVVAYHENRSADASVLYQYAEEALDEAKQQGKNTLAFFSRKECQKKLYAIELQEELLQSIQDGFSGFSLCYQPQVCSGTYELFGAEALLRYHSPIRGAVSPVEFVPMLEQTGMICPVGLWVLRTALNQCREWTQRFQKKLHISVNISYAQLSQENIAEQVLELLEESGLPGDVLTLEVTESMQLQDYTHFNKLFDRWKEKGIKISVDDFGTGYSSLGYLKNLDIDEIKIDRCFVSGIQHSRYNYRLLNNMVELARSSQITVCCEGVETRQELAVLERLGPTLLQGFLFSPPVPREEFERTYIAQDTPEAQRYAGLKQELYRV